MSSQPIAFRPRSRSRSRPRPRSRVWSWSRSWSRLYHSYKRRQKAQQRQQQQRPFSIADRIYDMSRREGETPAQHDRPVPTPCHAAAGLRSGRDRTGRDREQTLLDQDLDTLAHYGTGIQDSVGAQKSRLGLDSLPGMHPVNHPSAIQKSAGRHGAVVIPAPVAGRSACHTETDTGRRTAAEGHGRVSSSERQAGPRRRYTAGGETTQLEISA